MKRHIKVAMVTAAVYALSAVNAFAADNMIEIKGSDTLINLVQKIAEEHMKKHPDTLVAVTGGGSGTGIAALINGKCAIANASRQVKSAEVDQGMKNGVDMKRVVVAIDGLSIITNKDNPIKQMTVEHIGKIYKGEIANWSEIGGEDMKITIYGRQSNSGTYDFMKEVVMKGEYSPALKSMNGNAQIVEAIKQDRSGIGYVGVGYAKEATGITVLEVASKSGGAYYSPLNPLDVKTGKYPITRPLNQYVNGTPKGVVKDFILFELSQAGQKIVEEEGFFSIPDEYQEYNDQTLGTTYAVRGGPKQNYPIEGEFAK